MRILVLGRSGQLARAFSRLGGEGQSVLCLGRPDLDFRDPDAVEAQVLAMKPDAVINAAAYTQVDAAEEDEAGAREVNALGPEAAARACRRLGAPFLHISTDYVFDGGKGSPYGPQDPIAPLNAYGRTKAEGEARIQDANPEVLIVRTSWLYAEEGSNFLRTMLRLAQSRAAIDVVADRFGSPTWATDLASACLVAVQSSGANGVYHFAGEGCTSWAQFASAIFEEAGKRGWPVAAVRPIPASDYPARAARPINSALDSRAFLQRFGVAARPWRASLQECLDKLARGAQTGA